MGREKISDWKKRVKIRELGTNSKSQHSAVILMMNMTGKPGEGGIQIDTEKLGSNDGLKVLLEELENLYQENSTQSIGIPSY